MDIQACTHYTVRTADYFLLSMLIEESHCQCVQWQHQRGSSGKAKDEKSEGETLTAGTKPRKDLLDLQGQSLFIQVQEGQEVRRQAEG